jgi:hypothetical protein
MGRHLFGCAAAGVIALAVSAAAQNPPPQTPPSTRTPTTQPPAQMATLEGCLMKEADVPGRKPNVAERAGIAEDYILAHIKAIKGSLPAGAAEAKPGTPVGTSGYTRATMFEVTGIDDEELKKHIGRRVQIEGTFANVDRLQARPEAQTPLDDLAEIRGTAIRQVSGECPPK